MANTVLGTHGSGIHSARPAGNAVPDGSLYSCTTHSLIYVSSYGGNSWSTWATLTGTGLADPMTTRGDIIVRDSSNTTARLAKGAASTFLKSDGTDVSYGVPILSYIDAPASADTTTATDTIIDVAGCTGSFAAGTWRFSGTSTIDTGSAVYTLLELCDGSNVAYSMARGVRATGTPTTLVVPERVLVLGSTTTIKLRAQTGAAATVLRYGTASIPGSVLVGVRIA